MKRKIQLLATLFLISPFAANADPISVGVGNVQILGVDYVVSILADDEGDISGNSFDALAPTITFTTLEDATAAGEALLAAFGGDFDWSPFIDDQGFDLGFPYPTGGRIAYEVGSETYSYITINDLAPGDLLGPFTAGLDDGNFFSFIQFAAISVPEPGTLALLGIGLLGMGAARRRKKA